MYDGSDTKLEIPPLEVFTKNHYKKRQDQIKELSLDQIRNTVSLNSFGKDLGGGRKVAHIFGLKSFINHDWNDINLE